MSNNRRRVERLKRIGRIEALKGRRIMTEHRELVAFILHGKMTLVVGRITKNPEAVHRGITLNKDINGPALECLLKGGCRQQKLTVHTRLPEETKKLVAEYQQKLAEEDAHLFDQKV